MQTKKCTLIMYLNIIKNVWLDSRVLLEKLTGSQLVKKFPHILLHPEIHYRIHNSQPPVPIFSHINPVHAPTPLLEDPFLYYPPIYAWISLPQVSPPKPSLHVSSSPYLLHASSIQYVIEHIYKWAFVGLSYKCKTFLNARIWDTY